MIALVLAALFVAGSQRKVAPPFGPARNGEIVYDAAGDLYVGDPDTGATRLLVGGPEVDSAPSYSPDGTRVAFFRNRRAAVLRPSTSTRSRPMDRTRARSRGSDRTDIALANWTPDSRHLARHREHRRRRRLELLDAEGSEPPRRLAPDLDVADAVAFRPPSGDQIAFRALVDEGWGLFVMNADGTNIRPLLDPVPVEMDFHALNITYSADGERLFYQSYTPASPSRSEGCCQLWVMNADGSDAHAFDPQAAPNAWSGVPAVSPDGRWVSYWYVGEDAPTQQVRVAAADGSGSVIATGPAMSDFFPWLWAPDSSKILMKPHDGSTTSAYLIDPAGGSWSTVPWESGSDVDWQRLAP